MKLGYLDLATYCIDSLESQKRTLTREIRIKLNEVAEIDRKIIDIRLQTGCQPFSNDSFGKKATGFVNTQLPNSFGAESSGGFGDQPIVIQNTGGQPSQVVGGFGGQSAQVVGGFGVQQITNSNSQSETNGFGGGSGFNFSGQPTTKKREQSSPNESQTDPSKKSKV